MMVFSALLAAGIALIDTTDGVLMLHAHAWAFVVFAAGWAAFVLFYYARG